MAYNVVVTSEAEADLDRFIKYLVIEKESMQAATSLLNDFEEMIDLLKFAAHSLKYCENDSLKAHGYRRMNFRRHNYFILYRVIDDLVIIDNIFHDLQDYENILR